MALNISEIVRRFKADVAAALSAETITSICHSLGYAWRERMTCVTRVVFAVFR